MGCALVDQAAHGGDAGAGGDHEDGTGERCALFEDAGDGAPVEGDGEAGAGFERGEVAGADALADFAEDGAVFDEGDCDVEDGLVGVWVFELAS